jgi:hypothetical protein
MSTSSNTVSARRNIAWRGGAGPWDDPSQWNPSIVPYPNNTISCSGGTIVLPLRLVVVYDASINCQIQSPFGYGIQVHRALRMYGSAYLNNQAWLNVSSFQPPLVPPLDFIEQVQLYFDRNANCGGWSIGNHGNGIAQGSITSTGIFINRGSLTIVEHMRTFCAIDWLGDMVISSSKWFTMSGRGTLSGNITIQSSAILEFESGAEKLLRNVTMNMHDTAKLQVNRCMLRLAAPMEITVTNWVTWSDKEMTITAEPGVVVRITKQFAQWPEAGICGGGDSCYGGGKR